MRRILIVLILLLALLLIFISAQFAPKTSSILLGEKVEELSCLKDSDGNCLIMPSVSGINLDNETLNLPEDFTHDYYLVVMPFDREQQVVAITWLPIFRELAAEHDKVYFFNIAALPNLNPAIRLLVMGGMSSTVHDDEIRQQIAVLFLDEQAAFLDALAIPDDSAIQIFVMDRQAVVFYRDSGEYTPEKGQSLQDFIANLQV